MAQALRLDGGAYLVVGPNTLARDGYSAAARELLPEDERDFNFDEVSCSSSVMGETLLASLEQMPFMAPVRVVLLRNVDTLLKEAQEALVTYLVHPSPTTLLVAEGEKLAKNTRLYKAFAKLGKDNVIECASMKRWELPRFVVGLARERGKRMSEAAAQELVWRSGESSVMLNNQIDMLCRLLEDAPEITLEAVRTYVVRTVAPTIWEFLDVVSTRDLVHALELFSYLPASDYVALQMFLQGRLRELLCAKTLAQEGRSAQLASVLKKQQWQVKNLGGWASRFTEQKLVDCLIAGVEVERCVKGSGDERVALTQWIATICRDEVNFVC
jgi:DNA polymerase-3 subunit delta